MDLCFVQVPGEGDFLLENDGKITISSSAAY